MNRLLYVTYFNRMVGLPISRLRHSTQLSLYEIDYKLALKIFLAQIKRIANVIAKSAAGVCKCKGMGPMI